MIIIGLTGPTGAGKGEVSRILVSDYGAHATDADKIYHSLLVPPSACLDEIAGTFGKEILQSDGILDRHALADIVFCDSEKLGLLNRITHKYVADEIKKILTALEKDGCSVAVIDAPLLIEAGLNRICSYTISVLADRTLRKKRIIYRDGIGENDAQKRMDSQKPDSFYIENSDFVIYNNSGLDNLNSEIARIFADIGGNI